VPPESREFDPLSSPLTIRCLHCDYDLRGLAGDPVRCPECGEYTAISDYASKSSATPKAGDYSLLAAFLLLPICAAGVSALAAPVYGLAGLTIMLALWAALMYRVRRIAGGTAGWLVRSFRYQALVVTFLTALLGIVPLCFGVVAVAQECTDRIQASREIRNIVWAFVSAILVTLIAIGFLVFLERAGKAAQRSYEQINRHDPLDD
jgi:hypothetical protein